MKLITTLEFADLYHQIQSMKFPFKISYKMSKLNAEMDKNVEFYKNKMDEIIQEYGLRDEEGNLVPTDDHTGIKLQEGRENECMTKVDELQSMEIDKPAITFSADDFADAEFTPAQIDLLMEFIED